MASASMPPGLHASVAPWMKAHGVAILGGDAAQDVVPSMVEGVALPLHTLMITGLGSIFSTIRISKRSATRRRNWIGGSSCCGRTGARHRRHRFPLNAIAMF